MKINIPFLPFNIGVHKYPKSKSSHIYRNYNKVFCIGSGKTGTTSMENLLLQFGFTVGNQITAEVLSRDWISHRDATRILKYCETAEAFQDAPFGYPELFKILDQTFPGSKFILTVRDNAAEWYQSLVRFHTKLFSSDPNRPPNEADLKNALYRYRGYIYEGYWSAYGQYGIEPYNKEAYMQRYDQLNGEKRAYFMGRHNDFLEINLGVPEDFGRLCDFLNITTEIKSFPHENRTR